MGSRQLTKNKKSQGETLAPASGMFQGRSFAVQGKVEKPDLKTSLMRAERYGHHLGQIGSASVSQPEALQPKMDIGNPVQLARGEKKRPHPNDTNHQPPKRSKNYSGSRVYGPGQYGYRNKDKVALGIENTPDTYESEHVISNKVLIGDEKRGETPRARKLENLAPAYYEMKTPHRKHVGTGNSKKTDASGFTSETYRRDQDRLLKSGDVSSAVQINRLAYAHQPDYQKNMTTKEGQISTKSYNTMVENMTSIEYAKGEEETEVVAVDEWQRQEMLLADKAAKTGKWPTPAEIAEARKKAQEAQSKIPLAGQDPKTAQSPNNQQPSSSQNPKKRSIEPQPLIDQSPKRYKKKQPSSSQTSNPRRERRRR